MVRSILLSLTIASAFAFPAAAAHQPPQDDDHRGSGRRTAWTEHVRCPDGTKYRNSGCQPITHVHPPILLAYSENPTIPGSGTPQRSQGSGTR